MPRSTLCNPKRLGDQPPKAVFDWRDFEYCAGNPSGKFRFFLNADGQARDVYAFDPRSGQVVYMEHEGTPRRYTWDSTRALCLLELDLRGNPIAVKAWRAKFRDEVSPAKDIGPDSPPLHMTLVTFDLDEVSSPAP